MRHRLLYAQLTLDLQARRLDEALARIDTLLAELPEGAESERRGLLARAGVIAERRAGRSAAPAAAVAAASNYSTTGDAPSGLTLRAPQPNPTPGMTKLVLELPEAAVISCDVFDVVGRRVARLTHGPVEAGRHDLTVDTSVLGSGLYLVRATVAGPGGTRVLTQRVTVLR